MILVLIHREHVVTTKPTSNLKNDLKGASFTYAFKRINESLKNGYHLEAVTLAESIISDRLLSFVKHNGGKGNVKTPFHNLIQTAKKLNKTSIHTKHGVNLFDAIDEWRITRNGCIHSVSKSEPGQPTVSVEVFRLNAEQCAKEGKVLARLICDWGKKNR